MKGPRIKIRIVNFFAIFVPTINSINEEENSIVLTSCSHLSKNLMYHVKRYQFCLFFHFLHMTRQTMYNKHL